MVWYCMAVIVEKNLKNYLLISEAALFLGVSIGTLRNWARDGRITAYRHPANGYRLFEKAELEAFLRAIRRPAGQL